MSKGSSQSKLYIFRMQDAFADHHHHEQRLFMEERLACCKIFIHCMRSNYASVAESFILRNSLLKPFDDTINPKQK